MKSGRQCDVTIFNPIASTILKWLKFSWVVDALPALAQQWVGIVYYCWVHHITSLAGVKNCNQVMYFTVGQKRHKGSDVTIETRASSLL
jgi:hypothetical protein